MSIWEKSFLVVTGILLSAAAYMGYKESNWTAAAQTASVMVAGAVLVDSAITRRDSRNAVEATLADSRKIQESADRPLIVCEVIQKSFMAYLLISNQGSAPASTIHIELDEYPESSAFGDFWSAPMFTKGVAFLSVGQSISLPFDRMGGVDAEDDSWWQVFGGSVTYNHALDQERVFTSPIALDFQRFKGTHTSSTDDPVLYGARQLEKIAKSVGDIAKKH